MSKLSQAAEFARTIGAAKMMIVVSIVIGIGFQNCGESGFQPSLDFASELESTSDTTHIAHISDPSMVAKQDTLFEPLLVDRFYLTSLLQDVFGPSALDASINTAATQLDVQSHGSPCSVYENHEIMVNGTVVEADAMLRCATASQDFLSAQVNPKATVTRQVQLVHSCSDLTTNATSLSFALKKIASGDLPAPNNDNLLKAYRLFYRDRSDANQSVLEALSQMLPQDGSLTKEDWASVLYTLCISPEWQIL